MGRGLPAVMTRLPDWAERLAAYLTYVARQPWHPTGWNCAAFAIGALAAQTGAAEREVLTLAGFSCLPDTEMGVKRALLERGGMRGIAVAFFKAEPKADRAAQRGDLALLDGEDGEVLGVVDSGGVVCLTREGLWRFPLRDIKGYWPV